jgi:hypothetical protein
LVNISGIQDSIVVRLEKELDSGPVTRKKKTADIGAPPVSDQEKGGEGATALSAGLGRLGRDEPIGPRGQTRKRNRPRPKGEGEKAGRPGSTGK